MKIKILFVAALLSLSLFAFKTTSVPDPELYGKSLVETIRKNDKATYVNSFGLTVTDFNWLQDHLQADSHTSDEYKAEWTRKVGDSTKALTDMRKTLGDNYEKISQWLLEEQIALAELQYVRMYYEVEFEKQGLIHVLSGSVFVKHKEEYYRISFRDAAYINGRWVFGWISDIAETDPFFDRMKGGYGNMMKAEASMVDTGAVAYDTTVAVSDYSEEEFNESAYDGPAPTKKQLKILKKIEALDKKKDKLYSELFKD